MVDVADIQWGGYDRWEGPYFYGTRKYSLPPDPTLAEKMFDTIIRTEGGAPDLVNMYDRCKVSGGYFQWCESPYLLTSKLIGHIMDADESLGNPLRPAMDASGTELTRDPGRWRLRLKETGELVEAPILQERVFFGGATGLKKSWSRGQEEIAKLWAASLANMLGQAEAERIQVSYSVPRMMSFVMPKAEKILWKDPDCPLDGWASAVRTGFISFAGNLPAVAEKHLLIACEKSRFGKWSPEWCVDVLKELTFGPKIAIFPDRYEKIRPYLEKHFGVDLPDFADDLASWWNGMGGGTLMYTVREMQAALIKLGYDLGPAGVDGKMGPKTKKALTLFQESRGLKADGVFGPQSRAALAEAAGS